MGDKIDCSPESMKLDAVAPSCRPRTIEREWLALPPPRPRWPSTASTADVVELDVPSIAKEDVDEAPLHRHMWNLSLSAPEPNEWYTEASPSPEIGRETH
ncbi:hypothetical protein OIU85_027113 [Salix viminalis]|uniref:Uncharacterized protein n=1 Tax=Salix viminalis TaxID=40686 RepID=A0A9Q0NH71_SALVM|nr:hypothetical protein OIU85_027113 [Salix viminalis]